MDNLGNQFSPVVTWVPESELMAAGLAAGIFTHPAILAASVYPPLCWIC